MASKFTLLSCFAFPRSAPLPERLCRPSRRLHFLDPSFLIQSGCSDPSNGDARKAQAAFEAALKTEHAEAKRQWRFDLWCLLSLGARKALAETNQEQQHHL